MLGEHSSGLSYASFFLSSLIVSLWGIPESCVIFQHVRVVFSIREADGYKNFATLDSDSALNKSSTKVTLDLPRVL